MKQTIIFAALVLFMVGCGSKKTIVDTQPNEVCVWENGQWATDWMQKYVEYVRGKDRFFTDNRIIDIWNTWALAYIDDDKIPEMVLLCPGEAYGNKVLTIHDGKVVEWSSWRCNAAYIPKSGLIENNDGSMGEYWDKVVRLKDGQFTEIYNHTDILYQSHDKIDDTTGADEYYCVFNGDTTMRIGFEMDCHQYDNKLNAIFYSKGNAITFGGSLDHIETAILEKGWQPTPSDGATLADYKLTLSVR